MKRKTIYTICCILLLTACSVHPEYSTDGYRWQGNCISQENGVAQAVSPYEVVSSYSNPQNPYRSPIINYRFCINGWDGEMTSGKDHRFVVETPEHNKTQTIPFGERSLAGNCDASGYMPVNLDMTFTVDISKVMEAFEEQGYYVDAFGKQIRKEEFQGVWLAGSCPPLTWDFSELLQRDDLKMHTEDGRIYTVTLRMNPYEKRTDVENRWKLTSDLSQYPRYSAPTLMEEALYNMALEESLRAVESDSTLRTGAEWEGVWTRDVSYSILHAMSNLQTEVSKKSLLRKVDRLGRIIQDTGTGGSYPCSTDRIIWAAAAWEIFLVTGDTDWFDYFYPIVRRSVDQDLLVAYSPSIGLMSGEQSFLDWREQEYPRWMNPTDIAGSFCLGTNAVHYRAISLLSQMCRVAGDEKAAKEYEEIASLIKKSVNDYLWLDEEGFYGTFAYGNRNYLVEPRSETLGEALAVLWGIADEKRAERIIASVPQTDFGTPCFFPQIPNIPPYHNDAIWPFVQAYWMQASAKAGNETSVLHSIAAIYRPAAMYLTNKENMQAANGDWTSTQINSSNMLWSLAGNLSSVFRVIYGMHYELDGLHFDPFIPKEMQGCRQLDNFHYRNGTFDITIEGFGDEIHSFSIDGIETEPMIPCTITGKHSIRIVMNNRFNKRSKINLTDLHFAPETPVVSFDGQTMKWDPIEGAVKYIVLCNSKPMAETFETDFLPTQEGDWQVIAVDKHDYQSFASKPVPHYAQRTVIDLEEGVRLSKAPYSNYKGKGYINLTKKTNKHLNFNFRIEQEGTYILTLVAANANGPINTNNRCAMRTLSLDGSRIGTCIMSQCGDDAFDVWRETNSFEISLTSGMHRLSLDFFPENENMNIDQNDAALDYMILIKIK